MSTSIASREAKSVAAWEAFQFLKAGAKQVFSFDGDTKTSAMDKAANLAGVTSAQAERLRKNWRTMTYPNGDVYRLLRNHYGHLCAWLESNADALEARRLGRNPDETVEGAAQDGAGTLADRH